MADLFPEPYEEISVTNLKLYSGVAQINREDFRYEWKVKNFSLRTEKLGQCIKFTPEGNEQFGITIHVFPNGCNSSFPNHMAIQIFCSDRRSKSGHLRIKLYIPNGPSEKMQLSGKINGSSSSYLDRKFPDFVTRDVLLNKENGLLPNDTLTIICEVSLFTESVTVTSSEQSYQTVFDSSLSVDLNEMFEKGKLCDIVLVTKGNIEIPVHKLILAARSSVFSAMFANEMKENQSNRIQIEDRILIEDIDGKVMKQMLRYMYTGQVANIEDTAEHLLVVADKYALMGLKLICESECVRQLSVENAADMFCLADYHSAERLRSAVASFIKQNAAEVVLTDSWEDLAINKPLLMSEMVQTILTQK